MSDLLELFQYGFLQRAFAGGILIGISCALLGVFLVLRRESMIGHGLAHVTFGGVALAILLDTAPMPVALLVALAAAWWMEQLKDAGRLGGDTGIGIVSSLGMAGGLLAISKAQQFNAGILGYLFGDILSMGRQDLWFAGGLAILTIFVIMAFYNELIFATFDRETASTAGVKAAGLDMVLSLLTAVAVVIGMKVVGLLLVSALVIMPAASALIMASSFRQAVVLAVVVSVVCVGSGIGLSYAADIPASASIVCLNGGALVLALLMKRR